jgi:hypothetical protein
MDASYYRFVSSGIESGQHSNAEFVEDIYLVGLNMSTSLASHLYQMQLINK